MSKNDGDKGQERLIKGLLADEGFVTALAGKIAEAMAGSARAVRDPAAAWEVALGALANEVAEDCAPARLVEMFALTPEEIARVGTRLRTGALKGKVTLEVIRGEVLAQLGDDVLMARAGAAARPGAKACGDDYNCGQPYYCGYEVDCGVKYELFCPTLHICGSKKDCEHEYWSDKMRPMGRGFDPYAPRVAQRGPGGPGKRCTDEYQCGQPYYCGHEVQCGTPYELLPCGLLYHYACSPRKDCTAIYWNSGGT